MKSNIAKEITVKSFYNKDGTDILKVLRDSVLLFIEGEVVKICCQNT